MKALKNIFVVTCCVTFIVMTVAPSYALPCCCKTTHSGKTSCSAQIFSVAPSSLSCCSDKNVLIATCCDVINGSDKLQTASATEFGCQRCECPKNIQPVVVSENSLSERLVTYEFFNSPSKVFLEIGRTNSNFHRNQPLESTLKSTPITICSLRF